MSTTYNLNFAVQNGKLIAGGNVVKRIEKSCYWDGSRVLCCMNVYYAGMVARVNCKTDFWRRFENLSDGQEVVLSNPYDFIYGISQVFDIEQVAK